MKMERKELEKYKQYKKCYTADRHFHCIDCGEILDNVPVFNLSKNEEIEMGYNYLFIINGKIYHHNINSDLHAHRIDRLTKFYQIPECHPIFSISP